MNKVLIILSFFILPTTSCSSHKHKKDNWQNFKKCSDDTTCIATSKSVSCCSGCGIEDDDYIAISRSGLEKKIEYQNSLKCGKCPLLNCASQLVCEKKKAVCINSECRLKTEVLKTCNDGFPPDLKWQDMNDCKRDSDCFKLVNTDDCCLTCNPDISKLVSVNKKGYRRYQSFRNKKCSKARCEQLKCDQSPNPKPQSKCIENKCKILPPEKKK
ncbi:hypothetical protein KKF34_11415 [Myxococcota bacterium]|nr:hypothetical protein [Myxococcota bacterium]MBU1381721.1 hypothetical protein [Myxococcota bacterium]MBU1497472.1 hypothetical protein [Myxococcota bacterium]